jgi:CRP/FNR family cyclic AMP-dependent transcriptional regulator
MRWRLVEGVPEEDVRLLVSVARRRRFERNEVVFHRGDPADSLHLISKGRFAVRIMTPRGDRTTIAVRGPGDAFGEMALVAEGHRRAATVAALEVAETFCVYEDDFARLRRAHPSVDQVLLGFLAAEVHRQNELLLEALYLPAERRLLRRLHELAERYGGGDPAVVPLTQEELAEIAGTSRATVNRVLREEEERGTLELRRGQTLIRDRGRLSRRAR